MIKGWIKMVPCGFTFLIPSQSWIWRKGLAENAQTALLALAHSLQSEMKPSQTKPTLFKRNYSEMFKGYPFFCPLHSSATRHSSLVTSLKSKPL